MKNFRLILTGIVAVMLGAGPARADVSWLTDYQEAQKQAKSSNKLLLLDFTGSDWCGFCIRLHREVFSQPEFQEYAKNNLVLMEVDFPRGKEQTQSLRMQNQNLAHQYNIEGFPTIIVLNGEGKQLGALGYIPTGPNDPPLVRLFIDQLERLKKS